LIDYENIREVSGKGYRYLGFGRFAGIVGCYNTLNLYLKLQKEKSLPRAFEINSYEKIKELLGKQNFNKLKILQTGRGNVAKGSMEVLKHANIKQVSINDYLNKEHNEAIFCNVSTREYVERNDGKDYSVQDFTSSPHKYKSKVKNYLFDAHMLITGHYWEPKFPKFFYPNQINEFKNLKIIGDITCDINGAVPTTIRSTTIANPYYSIDINSMKEIDLGSKGIAVMAVDNLPSELPNESSEEFGDSVISDVLPYLINKDDGRISRATTASLGKFGPTYSYLEDFIK
jgi:alanine dehydrogenase